MLISLEVVFLSTNLGFILVALLIDDIAGFIYSMLTLSLAGIEISVGLALIILIYRKFMSIHVEKIDKIKN